MNFFNVFDPGTHRGWTNRAFCFLRLLVVWYKRTGIVLQEGSRIRIFVDIPWVTVRVVFGHPM